MIEKILHSREKRAKRQKEFLALYQKPLICVNVNIPGANKLSDDAVFIYNIMIKALKSKLQDKLTLIKQIKEVTGIEGYFYVDLDAKSVKSICIKLENSELLGRFIDFDVINLQGKILSRKEFGHKARTCYLCSKKAVLCARSRTHKLDLLLKYIKFCVKSYQKMISLADMAEKALLKEINLTPKPGLVDLNDSGSHKDMDKFTFYKSINAIKPFFIKFLSAGFLCGDDKLFQIRNVVLIVYSVYLHLTR